MKTKYSWKWMGFIIPRRLLTHAPLFSALLRYSTWDLFDHFLKPRSLKKVTIYSKKNDCIFQTLVLKCQVNNWSFQTALSTFSDYLVIHCDSRKMKEQKHSAISNSCLLVPDLPGIPIISAFNNQNDVTASWYLIYTGKSLKANELLVVYWTGYFKIHFQKLKLQTVWYYF